MSKSFRWISVNDRLPESKPGQWSKDVVAIAYDGMVYKIACMGDYWQRPKAFVDNESGYITHWIELPDFEL